MSETTPILGNRLFRPLRPLPEHSIQAATRSTRPAATETVAMAATPHPHAPIQYTRAEVAEINRHLQALSCVTPKGKHVKTPIVRGIFLDRFSPFSFTEGETHPAEAIWDTSDPTAPKVHPSDEACVLIDLETAPQGLLTNIELTDPETHQTSGAYIIKGQYLGHSVVLAYPKHQHTHYLESIAEELIENGVLVQQIILPTFSKLSSPAAEDETLTSTYQAAFPDAIVTEIDAVRNVMIGQNGVHFVKASVPQEYQLLWGEGEVKPTSQVSSPSEGQKLALGDLLKQTIENLSYEYAKQNRAFTLTADILLRVLTTLQSNPLFRALAERYLSETSQEALAAWPHVFNLLLAPLIMPLLVPSLRSENRLVTSLHSYYYAFSHYYRQYAVTDNYAPGYKMQEIVEQIAAEFSYDRQELSFLKTGCAYLRRFDFKHTIKHDTYQVVHWNFRYYSPFPFLFLSGRLHLLSIYGGYGYNGNPKLQAAIAKRGWHELVVAEYLRAGSSSDGSTHSYTCVAGLVEKIGFEPFAQILHVEAYHIHLGRKIVNYLLPAIASQVASPADLSVTDEQSLLNRYVTYFEELPESCHSALLSLSRFISSPADLDPSHQGSLGNYLAGTAQLPGGKAFLSSALPEISHLIDSTKDLNPNDET